MFDWYRYVFEDGERFVQRDISQREIQAEEKIHGKLVSKEFYGWF